MKDARIISPSDVRLYYFGSKDVLLSAHEKEDRFRKLQQALVVAHNEGKLVNFKMRLPTGEMLEMQSNFTDMADDFVIINGGFAIPVWAIVDVEPNPSRQVVF